MAVLTVNGVTYTVTENISLMSFLRDTLRLTSEKTDVMKAHAVHVRY